MFDVDMYSNNKKKSKARTTIVIDYSYHRIFNLNKYKKKKQNGKHNQVCQYASSTSRFDEHVDYNNVIEKAQVTKIVQFLLH